MKRRVLLAAFLSSLILFPVPGCATSCKKFVLYQTKEITVGGLDSKVLNVPFKLGTFKIEPKNREASEWIQRQDLLQWQICTRLQSMEKGPVRQALEVNWVNTLIDMARQTLTLAGQATASPHEAAGSPPPEPSFVHLTFERGFVDAARFDPKEYNIVYGAAWSGQPIEVFTTQAGSYRALPLGYGGLPRRPGTSILAVSSTGELALSRERRPAPDIDPSVGLGTLSLLQPGIDVPEDRAENVAFADFAPDGKELAIVRQVGPEMRLEYPIDKVLYRTTGWIGNARVSRDGSQVAFLDYPTRSDRYGGVAVVDRKGNRRTLVTGFSWQQGLAWSAQGDEVWFTANLLGSPETLYGVSLAAEPKLRTIRTFPGEVTLLDVGTDGRLLLANVQRRIEQWVKTPGAARERDLSYLDGSLLVAISADGSQIVFNEAGKAGGPMGGVYVARTTDGSLPWRLSDAFPFDLSPDGKSVLEFDTYHGSAAQAVLRPLSGGKLEKLPTEPLDYQTGGFSPDGRRLLLVASAPGKLLRTYVQDLSGGKARPITPEGVSATVPDAIAITRNGKLFVARDRDGRATLWPIDGGQQTRQIKGFDPNYDAALLFTGDGRLLVARFRELPMQIFSLDVATGQRQSWAAPIAPPDRIGVETIAWITITPDLSAYGYTYFRRLSDLDLVAGLK